jgi:tartrate-resistant acid phosphatase type 5
MQGNHSYRLRCAFIMIGLTTLLLPMRKNPFYAPHSPTVSGSSVHFAVIGDYGAGGKGEAAVAALVQGWQPDLILTTGDNNYDSGSALTIDHNIGQFYHDYIAPYKGGYGAGATVNRFFPVLGNHDWIAKNAAPYLDYFSLPGNERYYDFIWGPVHFFALDSDDHEPDGNSQKSKQALWLKQALTAAGEPWKVVFLHHSPYSSGKQHGSDETLQWPFLAWGASIVFSGHDHLYERILLNGFPYIVNGAGGAGLYDFSDSPLTSSVVRYNQDWGAVKVDVDQNSFQLQFISEGGSLIDTFSIIPPKNTTVSDATMQNRLQSCVAHPSYYTDCAHYLSRYPF